MTEFHSVEETKNLYDHTGTSSSIDLKDKLYVGRLAPSPTGLFHAGHARTFWIAQQRARKAGGLLLMRIEDLDGPRCKPHFLGGMEEDLRWLGIDWWGYVAQNARKKAEETGNNDAVCKHPSKTSTPADDDNENDDEHANKKSKVDQDVLIARLHSLIESRLKRTTVFSGIDMSIYRGIYQQTKRMPLYEAAWLALLKGGYIYPSPHSRKDVLLALSAPNEGDDEIIFPSSLRPDYATNNPPHSFSGYPEELVALTNPRGMAKAVNWRFRVPDGREISFVDRNSGLQTYTAGTDFGDFLVWRADGFPSYEMAVVVDDYTMGVTEVVRGGDLLLSTARQVLIYEALGWFCSRSSFSSGCSSSGSCAVSTSNDRSSSSISSIHGDGVGITTASHDDGDDDVSSSSAATIINPSCTDTDTATDPQPLIISDKHTVATNTTISSATGSCNNKMETVNPLGNDNTTTSDDGGGGGINHEIIPGVCASPPVAFFHCTLVRDPATGKRLAKRDGSLSLRALREQGYTAERIRRELFGGDEEMLTPGNH